MSETGIAVGYSSLENSLLARAFKWTQTAGMVDLARWVGVTAWQQR